MDLCFVFAFLKFIFPSCRPDRSQRVEYILVCHFRLYSRLVLSIFWLVTFVCIRGLC